MKWTMILGCGDKVIFLSLDSLVSEGPSAVGEWGRWWGGDTETWSVPARTERVGGCEGEERSRRGSSSRPIQG